MKNKNTIGTQSSVTEWLASTGFILPENETEYARFKKLYPNSTLLCGTEINPNDIIENRSYKTQIKSTKNIPLHLSEYYKLVASVKNKSAVIIPKKDEDADI